MAVIKLFKPGSNVESITGPGPSGPVDPFKDTEAGIDFVKKVLDTGEFGTLSTVGGDVEKETPVSRPEFVGTVTGFTFETDAHGISVEDISIDAERFRGAQDDLWWNRLLKGDDVVVGTDGEDTLEGRAGDDQLFGAGSYDDLYGGRGDDALFGGKGGDYLVGGRGENGLFGGRGSDTFNFEGGRSDIETGNGADVLLLGYEGGVGVVSDFSIETDRIRLAILQPHSSVEELIEEGALKIRGDEFHTVIKFQDTKLDLLGVAIDDFSTDLFL